jgi:predicted transcriptional regulator
MAKQRVTLHLDADVANALRAFGRGAMSDVANAALREYVERKAHQRALLAWLEELNAEHGSPTAEDYAKAAAFLDSLEHDSRRESGAA